MIRDVNGVEIMTGDIVKISNAYFKVDNGLYFVSDKEGDVSTCGTGLTLHKVNRDGTLSTAKYNVGFWPIFHTCNDRVKRALANEWDSKNATIEVVTNGFNLGPVIEHFRAEAAGCEKRNERVRWDWGKHSHEYVLNDKIRLHYLAVADRLEGVSA